MYAVLKTGGKQYKVSENDVIIVERLAGEAGESIDLNEVLMIGQGKSATVGTPVVEGATVSAQVLEQKRGKKITVFKKKRRKNYRRTQGHRQELTVLRITDILGVGEKKPATKKAAAKTAKPETKKDNAKTEKPVATKSATKKAAAKTAKPETKKDNAKTTKPATSKTSRQTGKVSKSSDTKE